MNNNWSTQQLISECIDGQAEAMADAAEQLFQREYAESLADATRSALIDRLSTDAEFAKELLDYVAEFGPTTRGRFVAMLEEIGAEVWQSEYTAQECALTEAMADQ